MEETVETAASTPVETSDTGSVGAGETTVETGTTSDSPVSTTTETASREPSSEVVEVQNEPAPTFPNHDEFDWEAWDKKVDSLPEQVRGWSQRIYDDRQSWYDAELKKHDNEMASLRTIYDELIQGNADPRLATLTSERDELQAKFASLEQTHKTVSTEYEEYKAALEEQVRAEGEAIAKQFREQNPEIFESEEKKKLFLELCEEDWDLDSIPQVMELGAEAMELARKARGEGVPDGYALQLARGSKPKPAKPRPAAKLTSGSEGASPRGHFTGTGKGDAKTMDEQRNHAVAKALRLHNGGRS
jgi:hypothetical protein